MSRELIESIKIEPVPDVRIRVISDDDTKAVKKNKKKFPFELHNAINVTITTTYRKFSFNIYEGYTWNGADIPRFLWRLVGSRTDNDFLVASMLHDFLLEFKVYMINEVLQNQISIKEYRRLTSLIFREKIKSQGTNTIKANVMSYCVDVFQMFNFKSWNIKEKIADSKI